MGSVFGFCGFKGSGKDYVANLLIKKFGGVKVSFASILKDDVAKIFELPRELLEGDTDESRKWREIPNEKVFGKTPRQVLINHGMNMRKIDPDYWINALELPKWKRNNELVFVTDVRFPNEIREIKRLGHLAEIKKRYYDHMMESVSECEEKNNEKFFSDVNQYLKKLNSQTDANVIIEYIANTSGIDYSEWAWIDKNDKERYVVCNKEGNDNIIIAYFNEILKKHG